MPLVIQQSCQGADGAAAGSSDVPATVEEDMSTLTLVQSFGERCFMIGLRTCDMCDVIEGSLDS